MGGKICFWISDAKKTRRKKFSERKIQQSQYPSRLYRESLFYDITFFFKQHRLHCMWSMKSRTFLGKSIHVDLGFEILVEICKQFPADFFSISSMSFLFLTSDFRDFINWGLLRWGKVSITMIWKIFMLWIQA